ncbi:hypothetical protein C8R44DRAFT_819144 [Mycena epipterygia]|nr:hypothetical protein C8R44DRAFT_819144 [Mycena epipterygia]
MKFASSFLQIAAVFALSGAAAAERLTFKPLSDHIRNISSCLVHFLLKYPSAGSEDPVTFKWSGGEPPYKLVSLTSQLINPPIHPKEPQIQQ